MAQFSDSSPYSLSSKHGSSTKAYFSSGQFLDILLYLIGFDLENQKNSLILPLTHISPVKARDIPKQ